MNNKSRGRRGRPPRIERDWQACLQAALWRRCDRTNWQIATGGSGSDPIAPRAPRNRSSDDSDRAMHRKVRFYVKDGETLLASGQFEPVVEFTATTGSRRCRLNAAREWEPIGPVTGEDTVTFTIFDRKK